MERESCLPCPELNSLLDAFYSKHAEKVCLDQWLEHNHFEDAIADDADAQ